MKDSVAQAMFKSHSYLDYREIVSNLIEEGNSSGNEQSEALTQYSMLNETRMNRLDKTIKISEKNVDKLKSFENEYTWLVITEGWCGDAAQIVPIINKMALESFHINLKIVFRDENEDLMNHFLTNNSKSIPKLIIINKETGDVLSHWGPRPEGALNLIRNYKEKFGVIDETAKTELQLWYLHDKGMSTQNEIMDLMTALEKLKLQMH